MKKTFGFSCLALSMMACGAWAAEVDMDAITRIKLSETSTPGFEEELKLKATEYVRADVSKLGTDNLSLHFYGWGKWMVDDGDVEGDLTTGYLNYAFPKASGYVKVGRFYEFQTTGIEQVDGLGFGADLAKGLRLTVFGGAPVRVDFDNKGDYIYGGKLSYRYQKYFGLGVSTVREKGTELIRLDPDTPGIQRNFDEDERFLISGSAFISPHKTVDFNANATYNRTTAGWAEQRYLLVLKPTDNVTVHGEYRYYDLTDYFAFASDPETMFRQRDKFRISGVSADVAVAKPLELSAFYKYYNGENEEKGGEGDSDRFGAQIRYKGGNGSASVQYMIAQGKQDEDRSFQQVYVYGMYNVTQNLDISSYALFNFYNRTIIEEDNDVRVAGTVGYRLTKSLRIAGQVAYENGPTQEDDVSGTLWLKYDLKI